MWLWVPTPPPFSPFAAASILISISISKTAIYHKHLACYKHINQHPTTLWPLRRLASRYHSPRWMIFDSALFTSSQRLSMSLCVHMSIKQNKSLVWCVYVINFLSVLLNAHFHLEFFSRSFSFALVFVLICFFLLFARPEYKYPIQHPIFNICANRLRILPKSMPIATQLYQSVTVNGCDANVITAFCDSIESNAKSKSCPSNFRWLIDFCYV